jgi:sulfur carrier protein ThiS
MITVDIARFASLSQYHPDGEGGRHARSVELPEGMHISDVIELYGLPDQPRVVFVNGRHAEETSVLADGDRLAIFPPVAGG